MQRIGGQYLAKRLADQLLAPPARPAEPAAPDEDLDGQVFRDDEGEPVGTARRVPGVAVYVVADGTGDHADELARCLEEPGSRLYWRAEEGRITGLIYAPDPDRVVVRVAATRADEV